MFIDEYYYIQGTSEDYRNARLDSVEGILLHGQGGEQVTMYRILGVFYGEYNTALKVGQWGRMIHFHRRTSVVLMLIIWTGN